MMTNKKWLAACLLVVLVVGVALRWSQLERKSLWPDELFTLSMAGHHPLLPSDGMRWFERKQVNQIDDNDSFLTAKAAEQSPPLNDLLEKLTVRLFGMTELAARSPAALASCMLLLWYAWFAWREEDQPNRRVLTWTTLLLALYPALQIYAQEGRAYSVGVALIGMGGLLWMRRWRQGASAWCPPGSGELTLLTLACYSHYNAALMVVLMLTPDARMALRHRSIVAGRRLLVVCLVFMIWLFLNAHAILFTAEGGAAWFQMDEMDRLKATLWDWQTALFGPWILLVLGTGLVLLAVRRQTVPAGLALTPNQALVRLACLVLAYLVLASFVVSRAGMLHPRFYVFAIPFVAVMMALILARVTPSWGTAAMVIAVTALAWPALREARHSPKADFRGMSEMAVLRFDANTRFLFPTPRNRYMYRIYLERLLGTDPRPQMISLSSVADAPKACNALESTRHVAVVGFALERPLTDAVYAHCGARWPKRERQQFHDTYAEHWVRE